MRKKQRETTRINRCWYAQGFGLGFSTLALVKPIVLRVALLHTSVLVRTGMIDAEKGNNLWSPLWDDGMHAFIMFQYQSGFPC